MSLIKWEPLNELDRLFDDRFFMPLMKPSIDLSVDMYEEDGAIVAKMSLPEIDLKDIDVTIEDNILKISGKREEEEEIEKKDYYSKEIRRGSFSRSMRLPKEVEGSKARASYKDGMLTISVPAVKGAEDSVVKVRVEG